MVLDLKTKETSPEQNSKTNIWFKALLARSEEISSISAKEKIFFVQNLQVMIRSGLALDRSLKTLAEQTKNKRFKKIITALAYDTEKGVSFTDSLKKYESVFGHLFISMVEAGEISGRLEAVLKQIYLQIKKSHELKSKVMAAMAYPMIVVIAMAGIGIGMMIFVVPKIIGIFDQMAAQLPPATKFLIGVSNFITHNGILCAVLAVLAVIFVIVTLKMEKTKYYYHYLFIHIPIFGTIVKKINLARFARTISSLIKTDIAIMKAFEITGEILGNRLYRQSLLASVESLRGGSTLTSVLEKYPQLYPPVIVQMTAAGEETGTVDEILGELADFYEEEIDQTMKTLPSIIEPILLLVLGAGVGLMAVAIIMPMYTLTQYVN
ncbi:MAG: type II secretion system F family protein [Candidatus Komeilibacteria bacterium]|nr:type II secretion system F family protein [Candidatus Komeilibacteria bacterium]